MDFPPTMAEFLDMIKERYGESEIPIVYKIVKVPASYDGSTFLVCDTDFAWKYDDLCVKLFDLDVSGWEISQGITEEAQNSSIGSESIFRVVTIHMTRMIW